MAERVSYLIYNLLLNDRVRFESYTTTHCCAPTLCSNLDLAVLDLQKSSRRLKNRNFLIGCMVAPIHD